MNTKLSAALVHIALGVLCVAACTQDTAAPHPTPHGPLAISELMTNNDAAWVDEAGETEDWIELVNRSNKALQLHDYTISDGSGKTQQLPKRTLAPNEAVVLFADDNRAQGELHLPFKLDSKNEQLAVLDAQGELSDEVTVPALEVNDAFARFPSKTGAFSICRYATPERDNGTSCGPPPPPVLSDDTHYKAWKWPAPWPKLSGPLVLTELALLPARFVEVLNTSNTALSLDQYSVRIGKLGPAAPWPTASQGHALSWGATHSLAPGERVALPVGTADTQELASDPAFEGVVTVFDAQGATIDRVDFMRWPSGSALTRIPDADGRLRFCQTLSEGMPNARCDALPSRQVGDRLRHLYTPGDFAALTVGETSHVLTGLKYVVDMQAGDAVHLLSTRAWALHYTWIRDQIEHQAPLDRCNAAQSAEFDAGWKVFSQKEYYQLAGRRYLQGMLDVFAGSGAAMADFVPGDVIEAPEMKRAFFAVMAHLDVEDLSRWAMRPGDPHQETELGKLDGQGPIVGGNAPFAHLTYQPLTLGTTYGVLRFVSASELKDTPLGPDVILVTDSVPNDIPFVGGLITEAFQTPLAHVNVLSQNRNTPNMALRNAKSDPGIAPYLGKLVRLDVTASGFHAQPASADANAMFWQARAPKGPRVAPREDLGVRGIVDLASRGLADLPLVGAKAAQLAELGHISSTDARCLGPIPIPKRPFAIPLVHYVEHFDKSGARALLAKLMKDPKFVGDPSMRVTQLANLREVITKAPVEPKLLAQVEAEVAKRWGSIPVRFRSSSNTEDLPGFNGAGLYVSLPGAAGDPKRPIEDAIRGVWASLWNPRAYDEREFGRIDQSRVAMGVLVHPAFESERANVIVISRDVLDPTRSDIHYMNAQEGEASVANPAPGVATEELLHYTGLPGSNPELEYQGQSSLTHGKHVLALSDARAISCWTSAVHQHFQQLLDPKHDNRWFAMDIELKLVGPDRHVVLKQARPYSFGQADVPADCREFTP